MTKLTGLPNDYQFFLAKFSEPSNTELLQKGYENSIKEMDLYHNLALGWVIKKKWDNRFKLPTKSRKLKNYLEPLGDLWLSWLNLAEQVHYLHPLGKEYISAGKWWQYILYDVKKKEYQTHLFDKPKPKKEILTQGREDIRKLRDLINPINPEEEGLHLWRLIEASCDIIKNDNIDNFYRDLWIGRSPTRRYSHRGLIDAWTSWINIFEMNDMCALFVEGGEVYYRTRGGGKKLYFVI